ncbi:MAG: hypothetical protein KDJ17_11830 [Hyphomicrobiaceae bacterium]|nr:hypothetical protein [Hyphomicrobiaceae bacterium]
MTRLPFVICALLMTTGSAFALTVNNQSDQKIKIGLDSGNKEKVETIAAGKSANFPNFCHESGCGISGPWGYSVMTKPGDTLTYSKGVVHLSSQQASNNAAGSTSHKTRKY